MSLKNAAKSNLSMYRKNPDLVGVSSFDNIFEMVYKEDEFFMLMSSKTNSTADGRKAPS